MRFHHSFNMNMQIALFPMYSHTQSPKDIGFSLYIS